MTDRQQAELMRRELVQRQKTALVSGEFLEKRLEAGPRSSRPSDEEISARYDRGEIRIVTEQARYPLESIRSLLASGNYKLDPDYQRRHRWSVPQKSRLVESFIMNVPVPPIFLYEYEFNRYEVMDGLQRLTALQEFYANGFQLTGLEYWSELEGLTYGRLPMRIKDGINRRYLSSIVLLRETTHGGDDPDRLKRFVFGRINTGGVQLSPQEVRNALYDGPMNKLCKELSKNPSLRRLWGIPENVEALIESPQNLEDGAQQAFNLHETDSGELEIPKDWRDMTDVELVLRFFANRQRMIFYRDNIRDYLDSYLQEANLFDKATLSSLSEIFRRTIALAEHILGPPAFRRPRGSGWATVSSVSIYDALMNVLSRMLDVEDALKQASGAIRRGIPDFYSERAKVFNLRGQTRSDVMVREIEFENYLRSFL